MDTIHKHLYTNYKKVLISIDNILMKYASLIKDLT